MPPSDRHVRLVNGIGSCSCPIGGIDFCNKPAYGMQTKEGKERTNAYAQCLACYDHGGPEEIQPFEIQALDMALSGCINRHCLEVFLAICPTYSFNFNFERIDGGFQVKVIKPCG